MNKIVKNLIVRPFIFLFVVIFLAVSAGLISDMMQEGTHFTRAVTPSKDAKLIKADYWGFMDPTIRFHFVATPKAIDDIIKAKGLAPVKNNELRVFGLPKNEEWALPPGEVSSYKYEEYTKIENKANISKDILSNVYVLQHNQNKNEAFYFMDSW